MSESTLSSSPTKSLASWWRNFKNGRSDQDSNDQPSNFLSVPSRPSFNRSSASSSAVPGLPPTSRSSSQAITSFGIPIAPEYADSPIFGAPLKVSLRYASVKISLADKAGETFVYGHVPIIIAKCAVYLKQNARETEGIFRIPGSVRRIRVLQDLFSTPPLFGKDLDWNGFTIHDAANLLKRYLAMLPEPIIPRQKYEAFREPLQSKFIEIRDYMNFHSVSSMQGPNSGGPGGATAGGQITPPLTPPPKPTEVQVDAAISIYENLIFALPKSSQQLLLYLVDLLSVFAAHSDVNRMPAYNLAAIFQPSVLTIPEHDMIPEESQISRIVIEFLVENSVALLKRVQEKAIATHELRKANIEDDSIEQGPKDYTPLEEIPAPPLPPSLTVSPATGGDTTTNGNGTTPNTSGDDSSVFVPSHARRHSKSLSSANPPSLTTEPAGGAPPASKLGFLRRQLSTRSRGGTRSPSEEAPASVVAQFGSTDNSGQLSPESEHLPQRQNTHSPPPPNGEEDRKSRFRRSLMILYPGRDS